MSIALPWKLEAIWVLDDSFVEANVVDDLGRHVADFYDGTKFDQDECAANAKRCVDAVNAAANIGYAERMSKPDRIRIDRGDFVRASGLVLCEACGVCYFDHPTVEGARWLHRACDGRLVKL